MALDSWKRLYSNTPGAKFREIAIAGLWSGADVPNSPTNEVRCVAEWHLVTYGIPAAAQPQSLCCTCTKLLLHTMFVTLCRYGCRHRRCI